LAYGAWVATRLQAPWRIARRSPHGSLPEGLRVIVCPSAETAAVQLESGSVSWQKPRRLSRSSGPPSRLWVCQGSQLAGGIRIGLCRNARRGFAGRRALVADIESGLSCRAAARRRHVSPTTACKWWRRWSRATLEQRETLSCLEDRSSRPHRSPRRLPLREEARICAARRRSGWGPRLIAGETGHPHATVWRGLRRARVSPPPPQPPAQPPPPRSPGPRQ